MVDVFADKHIWAVLDSGCNTTCHDEVWAQSTQKKLAEWGFDMPWIDEPGNRFAGLTASSHSYGKRYFPACLELSGGRRIPRTVKSHELPGDALLMLFHNDQGQLGITLETQDGVALLTDHSDEWLRVRRVAGSGLVAICTSDFLNLREHEEPPTFRKFYREGEIHSPADLSFRVAGP